MEDFYQLFGQIRKFRASKIRGNSAVQVRRKFVRENKIKAPKRGTIISWYLLGHATDFSYEKEKVPGEFTSFNIMKGLVNTATALHLTSMLKYVWVGPGGVFNVAFTIPRSFTAGSQ
ncbi:hypothetical protein TNCV_3878731 [Trichonephila clavipes]|nr:hypothetical protein TNCV_3878731 [Trichonephila clavipes]